MELEVSVANKSVSIHIENPFHLDIPSIMEQIKSFIHSQDLSLNGLDIEVLLPQMVRGIAGCENGCPADAKSLVSQGFKNFEISYIEGGILSAKARMEGKTILELKMFPEF